MCRILCLMLICTLGWPASADALRAPEVTESGTRETVRHALRTTSNAGAEESSLPIQDLLTQAEKGALGGGEFFAQVVHTIGQGDAEALEAALYGFSIFVGDPSARPLADPETELLGQRIARYLADSKRTQSQGIPSLPTKPEERGGVQRRKRRALPFLHREIDEGSDVDLGRMRTLLRRIELVRAQELSYEDIQVLLEAYRAPNISETEWMGLSDVLKMKRFKNQGIPRDFFNRHIIRGNGGGDFSAVRQAMLGIYRQERTSKILTDKENAFFFNALDVERIRPGEWGELFNFLMEYNLPLVPAYLKRRGYTQRYHGSTIDDLEQTLITIGLRKAVLKFKPEKGFKFSTYAEWWFKHSLQMGIDQVRTQRHIPQQTQQLMRQYQKTEAELGHELGRAATTEEIVEKLGWHKNTVGRVLGAFHAETSTTLRNSEEGMEFDREVAPESEPYREDPAWAVAALSRLDPKDRLILKLRYGIGTPNAKAYTLKEVGKMMGDLSREWSRQNEVLAMKNLRKVAVGTGQASSDFPADDHADVFVLTEMKVPFYVPSKRIPHYEHPLFRPLTRLGRENLEKIWAALPQNAGLEEKAAGHLLQIVRQADDLVRVAGRIEAGLEEGDRARIVDVAA